MGKLIDHDGLACMTSRRIVVVTDKRFEAHGLMSALLGRPAGLSWPDSFSNNKRLCVYRGRDSIVEVWCVEELIPTHSNKSDSQEKMRALQEILDPEPAVVLSLSTAAYPDTESRNGYVIVGTKIFNHSCADKELPGVVLDKCLDSPNTENLIGHALNKNDDEVNSRLLEVPLNPARPPIVTAKKSFVAVTVLNVPSYDAFPKCDMEALEAARRNRVVDPICSVETTHGLVRCCWGITANVRFLFISGITNRVGYYATEVHEREYAQKFVASHNAGIVAAYLIAELLKRVD